MYICIFLSFLVSVLLVPAVLAFCKKKELYDTTNERKVHSGKIPRLGSVAFVPAFSIASIIFFFFHSPSSAFRILPLVLGGLIIFGFGILDDVIELRGRQKLFVHLFVSALVISFGFRFRNILGFELPPVLGYIITFAWIIGVVNSYNLIDGVDALCGGLSFFVSITIGFIYFRTEPTITALSFILAAAILGFLVYNKPKAKIFMGDGGSQFLGFIIAILPLYKSQESLAATEHIKLPMMIVLSLIPIMDTIAAMWRRTREHRSFFSADKSHLHHKLMNLGFDVVQILTTLYSFQIFLCLIAYLAVYIGERKSIFILMAGFLTISMMFTVIHYINRAVIKKMKELSSSGEN